MLHIQFIRKLLKDIKLLQIYARITIVRYLTMEIKRYTKELMEDCIEFELNFRKVI